jgi:predicted secreted protein
LSSAAPEIRLQVGESRELELRGLGSAGYSWQPHLLGPAPPSGSLPELFEVTALAEGAVRVRFVLRREWEADESPLEDSEFDVVVETRSY